MSNFMKPELVVFDLDDTLYEYKSRNERATDELVSYICMYSNIELDLVKLALNNSRELVKKRLGHTASSHSRLLYISETFRQLGLRPDPVKFLTLEEAYWSNFLSDISLFPHAESFLELLRTNNISLALITDLTSEIQYRKLEQLNLNNTFDFILTSEDAGGDKRSGIPFEILAQEFSGSLKGAWFIGDSDFDFPRNSQHSFTFFKKVGEEGFDSSEDGHRFESYELLGAKLSEICLKGSIEGIA